ncbi:MAG: hypothetical protein ACHP9Y_03410, partial [Gammaproteobacteria bacterium]
MLRNILFTVVSVPELIRYINLNWQGAPEDMASRMEAAIDMCEVSFAKQEPLPLRNSQEKFLQVLAMPACGFQALFDWQRARKTDPVFLEDCEKFQRTNPRNKIKLQSNL